MARFRSKWPEPLKNLWPRNFIHNESQTKNSQSVQKTNCALTEYLQIISGQCSIAIPETAFRSVLRKKCSKNMQHTYRRTPMSKWDFNQVSVQLYWNCSSARVFSCKFAAYFQNTFSQEHLWMAVSAIPPDKVFRG